MPYAASIDEIQPPEYLTELYLVLAAPFVVAAGTYLNLATGGVRNQTLPQFLLSYSFSAAFTIATSSVILYVVWNEEEPLQILSMGPPSLPPG